MNPYSAILHMLKLSCTVTGDSRNKYIPINHVIGADLQKILRGLVHFDCQIGGLWEEMSLTGQLASLREHYKLLLWVLG